jgi:chorismate-pyruvate lyase
MDKTPQSADVELEQLIGLFYPDFFEFGSFKKVEADQLSTIGRSLLAHDQHMTVTVEKRHQCSVDVVVMETRTDDDYYSRKILLTRQSDGCVVQFGIVRINKAYLTAEVQEEIEKLEAPLGRILINHGVLRIVKLLSLLEIECGEELANMLELETGSVCYGRTALIYCNGSPAIELLEIVSECPPTPTA